MSDERLVAEALGRAALYRVLSVAFAYPTAARLDAIVAATPVTSAEATLALARLAQAAAAADAAALAGEHVTLFQRQPRCPPYEGAYGPPQMAGKAALLADVAGFYAAFGLEPAEGQPEVEDHVSVELEFMSALSVKEAWALAGDDAAGLDVTRAAQRTFVDDHLGRWAAPFARRVADEAPSAFLAAAAALLRVWMTEECGRLAVTPAPLDGMQVAEDTPFACPMAPTEES